MGLNLVSNGSPFLIDSSGTQTLRKRKVWVSAFLFATRKERLHLTHEAIKNGHQTWGLVPVLNVHGSKRELFVVLDAMDYYVTEANVAFGGRRRYRRRRSNRRRTSRRRASRRAAHGRGR